MVTMVTVLRRAAGAVGGGKVQADAGGRARVTAEPAWDGTAVAVPGGPLAAEDRVVPAAVRLAVEVLLENPEDVPGDLYEQLDKFADELAAGTARGADGRRGTAG
jgi:hypothetical protein